MRVDELGVELGGQAKTSAFYESHKVKNHWPALILERGIIFVERPHDFAFFNKSGDPIHQTDVIVAQARVAMTDRIIEEAVATGKYKPIR